jgi:hypothetical protein
LAKPEDHLPALADEGVGGADEERAGGDIVSVYTTFPWPAMWEEIQKLRITWQPPTLPHLPDPTRYTAVTRRGGLAEMLESCCDPSGIRIRILRFSENQAGRDLGRHVPGIVTECVYL